MDCRALAFRQLPHQPKLFLEYLDHFEKVKSFYVHPPAMPAVTRAARKLDYPGERRAEVTSILRKQKLPFFASRTSLSGRERKRCPIWTGLRKAPSRLFPGSR